MMSKQVVCDYCNRPASLASGKDIYPHRADLFDKRFWLCKPCGAYVGCHPRKSKSGGQGDGFVPLGRLANAGLRREKMRAHAAFDPLWKSKQMSRSEAYSWLASQLGIAKQNCHIGMMDEDGCRAVVAACEARGRCQ